jgi:predicted transcriptional regulator
MEQSWRSSLPASPEQVRQVRRRIVVLEAMGMSRRQIARRAGVAPSTITRLARGEIQLSRTTARALLTVKPGWMGPL